MRLLIIRHAEPNWPCDVDPGLTLTGIKESKELALILSKIKITSIFFSQKVRTSQTAYYFEEELHKLRGIRPISRTALPELNSIGLSKNPKLFQKFISELKNGTPWIKLWLNKKWELETPEKFLARTKNALKIIKSASEKNSIVPVFCHEETVWACQNIFYDKSMREASKEPVPYTAINVFDL